MRSFIILPLTILCLQAQDRYTVTEELAAGPGTPRVVVLHDNVAGVEAEIGRAHV